MFRKNRIELSTGAASALIVLVLLVLTSVVVQAGETHISGYGENKNGIFFNVTSDAVLPATVQLGFYAEPGGFNVVEEHRVGRGTRTFYLANADSAIKGRAYGCRIEGTPWEAIIISS